MSKRLLFLCTGNYYRSRFAELLFNALAAEAGLAWRAESRGLALSPANVGPISAYVLAGLAARGVTFDEPARLPCAVCAEDLAAADLIVAVSAAEHQPLLTQAFPAWAEHATYWQVEDIGGMPAEQALAALEREVRRLVDRLGAPAASSRPEPAVASDGDGGSSGGATATAPGTRREPPS